MFARSHFQFTLVFRSVVTPITEHPVGAYQPIPSAEVSYSFFSSENPLTFFTTTQFTPEELAVPVIQNYRNFLES